MHYCISLFIILQLFSSVKLDDVSIQTDSKSYIDFLMAYNKKWPFRRITFVYSTDDPSEPNNKQLVRNETAYEQEAFSYIDTLFGNHFSSVGISISSIRLPIPKGRNLATMLMFDVPNPHPLTLVLFKIESKEGTFIRQVSEIGEVATQKISWIVMAINITNNLLNLDLGLRPDSRVVVASLIKDENDLIAYISRWSGSEVKLNLEWSSESPINNEARPKGLFDLNSQKLSVAVYQDYPFAFLDEDKKMQGWFIDVWNELQQLLRFNSTYYIIESAGGFRDAAEELWSGRADAVIGPFTLTQPENIEYSAPVTDLNFRFYLQRSTTSSSWSQYIQPFSPALWYAVLGTLIILSVIMGIAYLIGRHYGLEDPEGPPIYNFKESFIVVFGSLLQQGPDYLPSGIGAGIVLWVSYVMGVVIFTAYGAALISKLTVRTVDPPFTTLDSYLQDTSYVLYMLENAAPIKLTETAVSGGWNDLKEHKPQYGKVPTIEEGLKRISTGYKAAFLAARERVGGFIQQDPNYRCRIIQIPNNILKLPARFIFQKNSPYKAAIDQQLVQMSVSGRLQRWRYVWTSKYKDNPCPPDSSLPVFGLEQVTLPFGIFGVGILLSFLALGLEQLYLHLFPHHHHTTKLNMDVPNNPMYFTGKKVASKKQKITVNNAVAHSDD